MKSYHAVKIDGAVGKCYLVYLVENEQGIPIIPIQKFYDESIAKKFCDELNMKELLNNDN